MIKSNQPKNRRVVVTGLGVISSLGIGWQDFWKNLIAGKSGIIATVSAPADEALEAIGGTGDTLTGIVAALVGAGMEIRQSAVIAARVNRLAGHLARPTPATEISEIIRHIPRALKRVLEQNG